MRTTFIFLILLLFFFSGCKPKSEAVINAKQYLKGADFDLESEDSELFVIVNNLVREIHEFPGFNEANKILEKVYRETGLKTIRADKLEEAIKRDKQTVIFHGSGTEPFWDVYITSHYVLFVPQMEMKHPYFLLSGFDSEAMEQELFYLGNDGKKRSLIIRKERTGDGMSDRSYPYSIEFDEMKGYGVNGFKLY